MHDKTIRRRRAVLALLVVVSLILLTDYFGESAGSPLHSVQRGIAEVLSPVQDGASTVLSPVRDVAGWLSSTVRAKSRNTHLVQENNTLRNQIAHDNYALSRYKEDQRLLGLENELSLNRYAPVSADVIGKDPVAWFDTITVNRGSDDGVTTGDPVVGAGGLVGDVHNVTSDSAVITLLTAPNFAAGAEVENDVGTKGLLQPKVGDPGALTLTYLPSTAQISPSQEVVTSGFREAKPPLLESLYPPGIPIGQVSTPNPQVTVQTSQQVQVRPAVNLQSLSVVAILTKQPRK